MPRTFLILVALITLSAVSSLGQFDFSGPVVTEPGASVTETATDPEETATASEEAATDDEKAPEPSTNAGPYAGLRDPFWPVGFTPEDPGKKGEKKEDEKPAEDPKWEDATKLLDVKGVMKASGGKYVAMINNQVVREGDEVSVKMGSLVYRWKIRAISSRGARFEPLTAERPE